jgi:hypothetical protein
MSDSSISNVSARPVYSNSNANSVNEAKTNTDANTAKTASNNSLPIVRDNAEGVTSNKVVQDGNLPNLDSKTLLTLKSYGVTLNPENLKLIAAIIKNMPGKVNMGDLLGLLISKKLPIENSELLSKYISGDIKFSALFANLSEEALNELRASWNTGKMLEKLENLVKLGNSVSNAVENSELAEEVAENLALQELFSNLPDANNDGNIYFQWPIFWNGQELPDCLEGEAFFPNKNNQKEGFCLRILVTPPNLGQTEISLTTKGKELYVHFGVNEKLMDSFRSIFTPIRENILALGDYESVQFTIGRNREHRNFFSREAKMPNASQRNTYIDFKA